MPIKYAVPEGRVPIRVFTALAARYTGCAVRSRDVLDGFDTHPASQNSGRFCYSIGKTRGIGLSAKIFFVATHLVQKLSFREVNHVHQTGA
jgi:hypothetical protein